MRIYTEVNFQWDDKKGKLVELSSDSFDYSGEMALCKKGDIKTKVFYDAAGNKWKLKGQVGWFNEIGKIWYTKNGVERVIDDTPPGDNKWSNQKKVFEKWVDNEVSGYRDTTLYDDLATAEARWESTFEGRNWDENLTTKQRENYQTGEAKYTQAGVDTLTAEAWGELGEDEQSKWQINRDTGEYELLEEQYWTDEQVKEEKVTIAEELIQGHIDRWLAITDPGTPDEFQTMLRQATEAVEGAETDITREYEKFFGVEGAEGALETIGETYERDVERLTGGEVIDPITGKVISEGTYTADIRKEEKEKEEGLEKTVIGREGELEALRGEAGENIRAAEAKIGAAGFASTGVGRTARDVLAEEIGGAARGIDEGFTYERTGIKEGYLENIKGIEKGKTTALEDYLSTGEDAARREDDPWESATTSYQDLLATYGTYDAETGVATGDLQTIQESAVGELESIQADIRASLFAARDPEVDMEFWDPFAVGGTFYDIGQTMGWQHMGAPFDPGAAAGQFGQTMEDLLYNPSTGLEQQMYTPEYTLPWEDGGGGGGRKKTPVDVYYRPKVMGGQR